MRVLGPRGNPQARNLFEIVAYLQQAEGVRFEVRSARPLRTNRRPDSPRVKARILNSHKRSQNPAPLKTTTVRHGPTYDSN